VPKEAEEALSLALAAGSRELEAGALATLALFAFEQSRFDEAERRARAAIDAARRAESRWLEANMIQLLTVCPPFPFNLHETRRHLEQGVAAMRASGSARGESYLQGQLLDVHVLLGDIEAARATLDRFLELTPEMDKNRVLVHSIVGHGELARGSPERALPWYEKALALARRAGARVWEARLSAQIALVWAQLGRVADARIRLSEAIETLVRLGAGERAAFLRFFQALLEPSGAEERSRLEAGLRGIVTAFEASLRGVDVSEQLKSATATLGQRMYPLDARIGLSLLARPGPDPPVDRPMLRVHCGGLWFQPPGGERVPCHRRRVLRSLLLALAELRLSDPGLSVTSPTTSETQPR
jgi:tetratricopeptide (TPR) repeat protein